MIVFFRRIFFRNIVLYDFELCFSSAIWGPRSTLNRIQCQGVENWCPNNNLYMYHFTFNSFSIKKIFKIKKIHYKTKIIEIYFCHLIHFIAIYKVATIDLFIQNVDISIEKDEVFYICSQTEY
jgi:hypothetical protein